MKVPSVVVLLVVLGTAYAQTHLPKMEDWPLIYQVCATDTGAKESYDDVFNKGIIPTTPKGMCLIECIMKKAGILNQGGGYNREGTLKYFHEMIGSEEITKHPEAITQMMATMDKCSKFVVTGPKHCEGATKMHACTAQL